VQPMPAAIPEVPFAKRRDQRGIAKIAVFAYHRETGMPVWQSGIAHQESSANDVWILGAGPFQRGTIYEGTEFAGKALKHDDDKESDAPDRKPSVELAQETTFANPQQFAREIAAAPVAEQAIVPAVHQEAAAGAVPAEPAPLQPQVAQPMPPAESTGAAIQAPAAGTPATTAAENAALRQLFSAAQPQNATESAITAQIYELPPTRQTGTLNVKGPSIRSSSPSRGSARRRWRSLRLNPCWHRLSSGRESRFETQPAANRVSSPALRRVFFTRISRVFGGNSRSDHVIATR